MALDLWTAEGGTPGAAFNTASSAGASGSAWFAVPAYPAGVTGQFSDEAGAGDVGLAFTRTSGTAAYYAVRSHTVAATRSITFMFMVPTLPGTTLTLIGLRGTTNHQESFIALNASNKLEVRNALNVAISTATNAISPGQWYKVDFVQTAGTTTTNGSGKWRYSLGAAGAVVQDLPITGANFGTIGDVEVMRIGRLGDSWIGTYYFDNIGQDNTTAYIGAVGALPPLMVKTEGPEYKINLRTSTAQNGGALTFSAPVWVSGPVLSWTEPLDGLYYFTQHTTTPSVYTFTANEAGFQSTANNYTIPISTTGSQTGIIVAHYDTATNQWLEND